MYKIHPPTEIPIGTCLGPIPNNYSDCGESPCVKCDILGMKFGTDMLNGAWGYPNGTTAQRTTIREAHIQYILGLLWFWQSDPSINQTLREEVSALGFCTDEYTGDSGFPNDPPHWPYRLRDNIQTYPCQNSGLAGNCLCFALPMYWHVFICVREQVPALRA
jgi:hypothetical protein